AVTDSSTEKNNSPCLRRRSAWKALESAGGAILATPGTSAYPTGAWETLWGVPLWPVEKSPRNIIQPGACWAFRGAEGRVAVALALPARLTHVTLEHLPASAALTGSRASAPRRCSVTGLETTQDTSGPHLGQFSYNLDGPPRQTFVLSNALDYPFKAVLLHIHNNHGNPEYTCVYRFRVHGNVISDQIIQKRTGI
ncbi:Unc-84-like protein A, partial [Gryllus bimaculatus]